jgi:hypothetical protein
MAVAWNTRNCTDCTNDFPVHKNWINPPNQCGPCRLILQKFVDTIEYMLKEDILATPIEAKLALTKLVKNAGILYRQRVNEGEERSVVWRSIEREIANTVWNDKSLRQLVLKNIKDLRVQKREDERAARRNEVRAAHLGNRTRRWSG